MILSITIFDQTNDTTRPKKLRKKKEENYLGLINKMGTDFSVQPIL